MADYFKTAPDDDVAQLSPTTFTGGDASPFNWQHTTTIKEDPFFEVQSPPLESSIIEMDAKKTKVSNGL